MVWVSTISGSASLHRRACLSIAHQTWQAKVLRRATQLPKFMGILSDSRQPAGPRVGKNMELLWIIRNDLMVWASGCPDNQLQLVLVDGILSLRIEAKKKRGSGKSVTLGWHAWNIMKYRSPSKETWVHQGQFNGFLMKKSNVMPWCIICSIKVSQKLWSLERNPVWTIVVPYAVWQGARSSPASNHGDLRVRWPRWPRWPWWPWWPRVEDSGDIWRPWNGNETAMTHQEIMRISAQNFIVKLRVTQTPFLSKLKTTPNNPQQKSRLAL